MCKCLPCVPDAALNTWCQLDILSFYNLSQNTDMHESRGIPLQRDSSNPDKFKNWGLVMAPLNMLNLLSSWHFSNMNISKILPQEVHLTTCFHHLALCSIWFLNSVKNRTKDVCLRSACPTMFKKQLQIHGHYPCSLLFQTTVNGLCRLPYFTF